MKSRRAVFSIICGVETSVGVQECMPAHFSLSYRSENDILFTVRDHTYPKKIFDPFLNTIIKMKAIKRREVTFSYTFCHWCLLYSAIGFHRSTLLVVVVFVETWRLGPLEKGFPSKR